VLASIILGLTWSATSKPADVQGGFTMGAFLLVAGTIPVAGFWDFHLHSKRCRCFRSLQSRHIEIQDMDR
jgi:hypothetical protein